MGILDNYKNQVEIDRANANSELPEDAYNGETNDEYQKAYEEELEKQRNDPNDIENAYKRFQKEYPKYTEEQLDEQYKDNLKYVEPKVVIKRFYCPQCGKEIVSDAPVMFNPFTLEKVARHECECGFKCNLDFAYPRVMFFDKDGKEITAYPR